MVPKVSMAHVLTGLGTLSTTRSPTLTTGERNESNSPATSSATASPAAADASPAIAPIHQGVRAREERVSPPEVAAAVVVTTQV